MADTLGTLVFDEYPDDEIVVKLAPVPMRLFFQIMADLDQANTVGLVKDLYALFIDSGLLVSWTFPEPCTLEGYLERDKALGLAIVRQWIEGVRSVPLPLPLSASGGTPSTPEASPSTSNEPSSSTPS